MSIPNINNYDINGISVEFDNKPGWTVDPARCVLLIHDMQRYFLSFYERQSQVQTQLIENIKQIKNWSKQHNVPCIYTAQPGDQEPSDRALLTDFWGRGLKADQEQTAIVEELQPESGDAVVDKWRYSAFKKNNFQQFLESSSRDQIVIVGVYAHIGILATALEAFMLDYQPFVVSNAVADFSQKDHIFALDYIAKRCGVVIDTNNFSTKRNVNYFEPEQLKAQIAQVLALEANDIPSDQNLQHIGLDSIRLMTLMEQWQRMGVNLEFSDLMEDMTVDHWLHLINKNRLSQVVELNATKEPTSYELL